MTKAHLHDTRADAGVPADVDARSIPWYIRTIQYVGAAAVTLFALWFLFGIPAYLLFAQFFARFLE